MSTAGVYIYHPRHAEPVDAHAELVAPGLLLHRHRGRAAGGQLFPVPAQRIGIVTAEADRASGHGLVFHVAGDVGGHDRVAGVRVELTVHDPVGVGRALGAEVSERVEGQVAAEHAGVELQRLAGVAVEVEVWVQSRCHGYSPLATECGRTGPSGPRGKTQPIVTTRADPPLGVGQGHGKPAYSASPRGTAPPSTP